MPFKRGAAKTDSDLSHPAFQFKQINEEIVAQLTKLPQYLPTERDPYYSMLKPLRSNWKYSFVFNWLSIFRGAIKLSNDSFNIHIWEEELSGLTTPPVFLNRLKLSLMNNLLKSGFRSNAVEEFDNNIVILLGDELTSLLEKHSIDLSDFTEGTDMKDEEFELREDTEIGEDGEPITREQYTRPKIRFFDFLPLDLKIEILHSLIMRICYLDVFKRFIEKFEKPVDLRLDPIFSLVEGKLPIIESSYFLLDDNRLYQRKLIFNKRVKIPSGGKKLEKFDPTKELENIDPEFEWECLNNNFYELYDLVQDFKKNSKLKNLGLLLSNMLNDLATQEMKWKKNYQHRLRERNMQNLLVNRKRSSRLQQKEERKKQEEEERRAEQERLIREGAALRAAKRMKVKEEQERNAKLEREQRASKRQGGTDGASRSTTPFDGDNQNGLEPSESLYVDQPEELTKAATGVEMEDSVFVNNGQILTGGSDAVPKTSTEPQISTAAPATAAEPLIVTNMADGAPVKAQSETIDTNQAEPKSAELSIPEPVKQYKQELETADASVIADRSDKHKHEAVGHAPQVEGRKFESASLVNVNLKAQQSVLDYEDKKNSANNVGGAVPTEQQTTDEAKTQISQSSLDQASTARQA